MPKSKRQDRHSGDSDEQPNASSRESSCPYEILGVPRDATYQQIKVSYRKLALRHHPDRQTSESDKKVAHERFASIGHAYEILGDEGRRREYDEGLVRQQARHQGRGGQSSRRGGFDHDPFSSSSSSRFNDPFFSSPFGGGSQRQRSSSARTSDFHFTDPFELFEQFFAEEMGGHRSQRQHEEQQQNSSSRGRRMDPFASDPFFSDPFSSSSSFGGSGSMMGGSSLFGMHNQMMNSMMSQMHSSRSMFGGFDTGQSQQQQIMMSSSSSTRGGGGSGSGHRSVSTSTRTTIVNGVRKTIHERTVVHPDGRVERHVTTDDGNDNVGRLSSSANNYPALDYDGKRSRSRRSYR